MVSDSERRPEDHAAPGEDTAETELVERTQSNTARILSMVVGAGVLGLIVLLALGGGGSDDKTSRLLEQRVPEVAGVAMDGTAFDVDDYRGQWVLVNFFATWCPPCVAEHPELVRLDEWGEANGRLEVVSVVFNDEPADVEAFFAANGGEWPVLSDPGLAIDFQVSQVPETFLVSPDGIVVAHLVGGITAASVIEAIS